MKNFILSFFLSISFLCFSVENEWHNSWLEGLKLVDNLEYDEAKKMFISALSGMTEKDLQEVPDVLISLAQTHYMLCDFEQALSAANRLLTCWSLSDHQKLICGNLVISSLWKEDRREEAEKTYEKYIINSPMAPKGHFTDERIIITNVPSCTNYEKVIKNSLIHEFCNNPEDFHDYGNIWILDATKTCKCQQTLPSSKRIENKKRNPEVIRACCNTCSTLAVTSAIICSAIPHTLCKTACGLFVELIRQICEECCYKGGIQDKCWERFSFWKDEFHDQNPNCPHPNDR